MKILVQARSGKEIVKDGLEVSEQVQFKNSAQPVLNKFCPTISSSFTREDLLPTARSIALENARLKSPACVLSHQKASLEAEGACNLTRLPFFMFMFLYIVFILLPIFVFWNFLLIHGLHTGHS